MARLCRLGDGGRSAPATRPRKRAPGVAAAAAGDHSVWESYRKSTPGVASGTVHLNNAGASLPDAATIEAVRAYSHLEDTIGGYEAAEERAGDLDLCYSEIGDGPSREPAGGEPRVRPPLPRREPPPPRPPALQPGC